MKTLSPFKQRITTLLLQHAQASIASFGRLYRTPFASLLTMGVIAITLALPTTFFSLINTTQHISDSWQTGSGLNLFLYQNVSQSQAERLIQQLEKKYPLVNLKYVPPEQGLHLLAEQSGVNELLTGLPSNPLPGVIAAETKPKTLPKQKMQQLITELNQETDIDSVQIDLAWLERLHAILSFSKHLVMTLSLLLAASVFLIVANTIRLTLQNTKREVAIFQLIGATHAFIRRPLLYIGFWYCLGGSLLGWLMVDTIILGLQHPVQTISQLYDGHAHLNYLSFSAGLSVCTLTILLGLSAAWIIVKRYSQ